MRHATWIFRVAGIYGLIVMLPQYFLESQIGIDVPPPITHPEYFYGFVGVVVAWQLAFLIIGQDPVRFRPLMLAAMVEKGSFSAACLVLAMLGRISNMVLVFAGIDTLLGLAFLYAYLTVGAEPRSTPGSR